MVARERRKGEVVYNDGWFAEVQTCGVEGVEKGILLETIQIHIEDTTDAPEKFKQRFPVGTWLNIWRTTKVAHIRH